MTYKITRFFASGKRQQIKSGLTRQEAQDHCSNPETCSNTATTAKAQKLTARKGKWFDGFNTE